MSGKKSRVDKGGRPSWRPSEEQVKQIETMAAMGIPQEDMGKIVGVEAKTLRKHCRKQLDTGSIKATLKVAQSLFKQATEESNTAAMIFWMKARAGWSEKTKTEITGADGSAIQHEHKVTRVEIVAASDNGKN